MSYNFLDKADFNFESKASIVDTLTMGISLKKTIYFHEHIWSCFTRVDTHPNMSTVNTWNITSLEVLSETLRLCDEMIYQWFGEFHWEESPGIGNWIVLFYCV